MTNWLKLERGDSYLQNIADVLGNPNSLTWSRNEAFHAWLDLDTSNWVAVFADAEEDSIRNGGGTVRTYLYLAAQKHPVTFKDRLRVGYDDTPWSDTYGTKNFTTALTEVTGQAATVLGLPLDSEEA